MYTKTVSISKKIGTLFGICSSCESPPFVFSNFENKIRLGLMAKKVHRPGHMAKFDLEWLSLKVDL